MPQTRPATAAARRTLALLSVAAIGATAAAAHVPGDAAPPAVRIASIAALRVAATATAAASSVQAPDAPIAPAEPRALHIVNTPYRLSVTPAAVRDALEAGEPFLIRGRDIVVLGDNLRLKLNCSGENVIVLGDGNRITVAGDCAPLLVSGSGNLIEVEKVRYIETRGDGNAVLWNGTKQQGQDGKPRIVDSGDQNVLLPVVDL